MPMRLDWIEALHARLVATYGARFMAGYGEMPPELIRASWSEALDGMTSGDIAYALQHLDPDYPPNVLQFRRLAQARPRYAPRALEAPKADPARVREALDRMAQVQAASRVTPRAWIAQLQARQARGERLTRAQAECLRAAAPYAATPHQSQARTQEASNGAAFRGVDSQTLRQTLSLGSEWPTLSEHSQTEGPGGSESAGPGLL
jgi:type IV secretory pathway VirB10-like protein